MKASAILTNRDIERALIEYVRRMNSGMSKVKEFNFTFDIESPTNSSDPRENTMGGLKGVTITEK